MKKFFIEALSKCREEFNFLFQTNNPKINPNIQYCWVLSSRHDALGNHLNCAHKSYNYKTFPEGMRPAIEVPDEAGCDREDDFLRVKAAVKQARAITAIRAKKKLNDLTEKDCEQYGPYIIYNGFVKQNQTLRAMINGELPLKLPAYSSKKYIIFDMPKDNCNTAGQFTSFAERVANDSRFLAIKDKQQAEVRIFTSAYHIPRVRRLFNSKKYTQPFGETTPISFYCIDRQGHRKCIERDVLGESLRLKLYLQKGFIGQPRAGNWYGFSSMKNWIPLRQTHQNRSRALSSLRYLDLHTKSYKIKHKI